MISGPGSGLQLKIICCKTKQNKKKKRPYEHYENVFSFTFKTVFLWMKKRKESVNIFHKQPAMRKNLYLKVKQGHLLSVMY